MAQTSGPAGLGAGTMSGWIMIHICIDIIGYKWLHVYVCIFHYTILLCHIIWSYLRLDYHFMLYENTIRFTQVPSQELTSEVRQRCISAFRTILMGSQRPGWVEFLRKFPWFCLRKSGKFRKLCEVYSLELLNYLNPTFMSTCHYIIYIYMYIRTWIEVIEHGGQ